MPWLCAALAGVGACRAPSPAPPRSPPPAQAEDAARPFYEGTAAMRERAARAIASLDDDDLRQRLEATRVLAQLGEPAYPLLIVALAEHPSPRTRSMAAYTLGYSKDHRTLAALARALGDPEADVRLETSAALVRLSDPRGLATLVGALEDGDPRVRSRAILVLQDATGDALGFAPDDDPLERQAAVARWRGWLEERRRRVGG